MPEFVLDEQHREGQIEFGKLPEFVQGYIEAMFFTESGEPHDPIKARHGYYNLSDGALNQILEDCNAFFERDLVTESLGDAQLKGAGRDFWYTRNGHGVGFWCRDPGHYNDPDHLTKVSESFGEANPYSGDDGFIYF